MRKDIFGLTFLLLGLISCSKERPSTLSPIRGDELKDFAVLLSKALYHEPELRVLFKDEALKRPDYDFDVVYSLVKEEEVRDGYTVEHILKKYDTDGILEVTVSSHPLLTILVPDWSWINEDCFSVRTWDTDTAEVGVSWYGRGEHPIYCDGEFAFSMQDGEFNTVPILIVKDNELLKSAYKTKGGDASLDFFFEDHVDVLDKEDETKSTVVDTVYFTTGGVNPCFLSNILHGRTYDAYRVAKNDSRIAQRDYIYFGMTSQVDTGVLSRNYVETLYAFYLSPCVDGLYDNPTSGDYTFKSYTYGKGSKELSSSELARKTWGDGKLEIAIYIYNGGSYTLSKAVYVPFKSAFYVKKVYQKKTYNLLGKLKSRTYYLDIKKGHEDEWLAPKWITVNLPLFNWDPAVHSTRYKLSFYECDDGATYTTTNTSSYSFMANISSSVDASAEVITVKRGYQFGGTYSKTVTYSTTMKQEDDYLRDIEVVYTDDVVTAQYATLADFYVYDSGAPVHAVIIPMLQD